MNQLKLYNYLTSQTEIFQPKGDSVKIYKCGPTVYDVPHLGHARTYIAIDCLERVLKHYLGYDVRSVMNITDLDDKIIKKGCHVAQEYEKVFFETMDMLNVRKPSCTPRVTENLEIIHDFVHKSLKDFSYKCFDDIIFDSTKKKFPDVFPIQTTFTKSQKNFVLWKSKKHWIDSNGKVQNSIPGWHSECAALAAYYLGNSIDIHVGGIDLKFPHHENEITLGRTFFNREKWVRFCLYTGHVHIDGLKMSKSLKNFITVEDLISKNYSPLALRYLFLNYPYSKNMTFSEWTMKSAQKSYDIFMRDLQIIKQHLYKRNEEDGGDSNLSDFILFQKEINDSLLDNLNIPKVLDMLEKYVHDLAIGQMHTKSKLWLQHCVSYILWIVGDIFGLIKQNDEEDSLNQLFQTLKQFRSNVRHWALNQKIKPESLLKICDDLREEVNKMGYPIEDKTK